MKIWKKKAVKNNYESTIKEAIEILHDHYAIEENTLIADKKTKLSKELQPSKYHLKVLKNWLTKTQQNNFFLII